MKALKTLLAIALSAGGLGTAVTLGAVSIEKDANDVQIARASGTTSRRYLDCSNPSGYDDESGKTIYLHSWGSSDKYTEATQVENNFWYVDIDLTGVTGYQWCRGNGSGSYFNHQKDCSNTSQNYYVTSGWDNSGTWSTYSTSWSLNEWVDSNTNTFTLSEKFDSDGLQFYNKNVTLTAGGRFKIKDETLGSSDGWYGFDCAENSGAISSGDLNGQGSGDVNVVLSGTYEVYMKPSTSKFYIKLNDDENAARNFAKYFLDKTKTICETGSTADDHSSALAAIWVDTAVNNQDYELMGTMNEWTAGSYLKKDPNHDNIYIYPIIYLNEGDEFKVRTSGTWDLSKWPNDNWHVASDQAGYRSIILNTNSGLSLGDPCLSDYYNTLTAQQKSIFAAGTANATIADANARYRHIIGRYNSLTNFAGLSGASNSNIISMIAGNNTYIVVAITSIIAIASVGAFFLLRKKRKEQ